MFLRAKKTGFPDVNVQITDRQNVDKMTENVDFTTPPGSPL
jgi:hypothetical protein